MATYIPLWVKSAYSFLQGASHPHELVEQAHRLGLEAIAITDLHGMYGVVQAHMRAKELGIRLLVGAELEIFESEKGETSPLRFVALAQNRHGYGVLCTLITQGRLRSEKGSARLYLQDLYAHREEIILIALQEAHLETLQGHFKDRLYVGLPRHLREEERAAEKALQAAAHRLTLPMVALNEVLYHTSARQPLHDVLTCIHHGVSLKTAGDRLRPNHEYALKDPLAMQSLFMDAPQALAQTLRLADRCHFSMDELVYRYPASKVPGGVNENDWLKRLCMEGAQKRYPQGTPQDVLNQLEKELTLISELCYGGYFLTMYEIVGFCRRQGILCQGRGSAANSVVCYCLGITAVDPIQLDLLFERFISRERAEPPDIDLDIEHERREEVLQWVYQTYGRDRAAMVANIIRYRKKSAVRDVGKALGISENALDKISKLLGGREGRLDQEAMMHGGLNPALQVHQQFMTLVHELIDFPRHLSIHPGGFVLGHEPISTLVPIENATMKDRTVIQWDKYSVKDLGLFKVDLLGLGALTHARKSFELMAQHLGKSMELADIPVDDPQTYAMISQGQTLGVFQIESRAQMSMLPRLKPKCYYDLVIQVAIVRPGPIQGDMVHPYLRRRDGKEEAAYPHPSLRKVLAKTLGVPIFQEQVMKIAMLLGGYSGGEADQLRKDMAAWKSSGRIERHHQKLTSKMIQNGLSPEYAERIFDQIRGFGEYGFPESHAASFALIAYATAWLRCHYPVFFYCGLLNSLPMGFYSAASIVEDAKRQKIQVLPMDIQYSHWHCTLEPLPQKDFALRMGLRFTKGLPRTEAQTIIDAQPPFKDLKDLIRRTGLSQKSLKHLAESGALKSLPGTGSENLPRRQALWDVPKLHAERHDALPWRHEQSTKHPEQGDLFAPLAPAEEIFWDYRSSHHSARGHPMAVFRSQLTSQGVRTAQAIAHAQDGQSARYVGMVICRQQPGTRTGVTFFTLEDETGFVNLVVWRPTFEKYRVVARKAPLLGVQGKVQREGQVVHLIAQRLWQPDLSFSEQGVQVRSFM